MPRDVMAYVLEGLRNAAGKTGKTRNMVIEQAGLDKARDIYDRTTPPPPPGPPQNHPDWVFRAYDPLDPQMAERISMGPEKDRLAAIEEMINDPFYREANGLVPLRGRSPFARRR